MGADRIYEYSVNPLNPPLLGEIEGRLGDTPKPPPKGLRPFGIPFIMHYYRKVKGTVVPFWGSGGIPQIPFLSPSPAYEEKRAGGIWFQYFQGGTVDQRGYRQTGRRAKPH